MLGNTLHFLYLYVSFYSSPVLPHNLHFAKYHWFLLLNNPMTSGKKKSHVRCLRQGKDNAHCRQLLEVCISHSSNFKTAWPQCTHLAETDVWKSNLPSREVLGFDFSVSDVSQSKTVAGTVPATESRGNSSRFHRFQHTVFTVYPLWLQF